LDPTKIFHRRLSAFERLKFAMERGENIPSETRSPLFRKITSQAAPDPILSRVFTIEGRTYRVCRGYGVTFEDSLENMSIERDARRIRCPTVALAAGMGAESN